MKPKQILTAAYEKIADGFWSFQFPTLTRIEDVSFEDFIEWDEFLSDKLRKQLGCDDSHANKTKTWADIIYPKDLPVAYDNFIKHVNTKGEFPYTQVVRYRTYTGKHIRVLCSGAAIFLDDGTPVSMTGIHKLLEVSDTPLD